MHTGRHAELQNVLVIPLKLYYSVMQSDGNSLSGDVVLDNFNRAYLDEFNISDQIYKGKYVWIIFMMILILYNIIQKCVLTHAVALKPNLLSSLLLCAVFL